MGLWTYVIAETSEIFVGGIPMPDWWPLLGTVMNTGGEQEVIYLMLPLVAGLGYSDLALSSYPRNKRIKTARNLAIYSLLLSSLAVAAAFVPPLIIAAALVAPLGHELLILKGNKEEFSGSPLFKADNDGSLIIMAVVPGSPAGMAGLKGGDRLIKVNNYRLGSENDFWNALQLYYNRVLLNIIRDGKNINIPVQIYPQPISSFGVIFPPGRWNSVYVEMKHSSLWKKIRNRFLPGRS
jgi:membrane-associated protease RseP (regulator of RpoE activity)